MFLLESPVELAGLIEQRRDVHEDHRLIDLPCRCSDPWLVAANFRMLGTSWFALYSGRPRSGIIDSEMPPNTRTSSCPTAKVSFIRRAILTQTIPEASIAVWECIRKNF